MSEVVKVSVVADTSAAQQQLQSLKQELQAISSMPINVNDSSLVEANKAALELQQTLAKATNPNTKLLDLSVFSRELSKSGQTLAQYQARLSSIGPTGQQAFLSLAKSIATAEAPVNRVSQKLVKFGQTIKNTINWQISSSIIHGIIGQFSQAINYAEKLNTSLTNIRIVTGASVDKMADFAKEANEAARKLSTTTTAYTNASLIYYQQGLSDKEVAARTEVTLKMANVTGQSAQEVSNQMTAIWNNFATGSENLEHYADVITALGAATASSSAEIATGLEKFASIANTVGLSYENATAALATITATTRQSAETVGTGLRTIFARLSNLKLGETLEDGVSLTKYTKALETVGVKALDASGNLRNMNDILSDLGERWSLLSKTQQTALAQTVGGVRQYTNIMALMEHYGDYEENLKIAQDSDGTLQKQQERYEQGWQAASKRVRASTEAIYKSLLNDKAIIKMIDGFGSFLDIINNVINGLGGVQGILLTISSIIMNKLARNVPTIFQNLISNMKNFVGYSAKEMSVLQQQTQQILAQGYSHGNNPEQDTQIRGLMQVNAMNQQLTMNRHRMSPQQIEDYQTRMANVQQYYANLQPYAKEAAEAKAAVKEAAKQTVDSYVDPTRKDRIKDYIDAEKEIKEKTADAKAHPEKYLEPGQKSSNKAVSNATREAIGKRDAVGKELEDSDKALERLVAIKRKTTDSTLKQMQTEKADLEAKEKERTDRLEILGKRKALLPAEKAEKEDLETQQKRLEQLRGTKDQEGSIAAREKEIEDETKKDVSEVSSKKMIDEAKKGGVEATTLARRRQLESEAIEGLSATSQKQAAFDKISEQVLKQQKIWSPDKLQGMNADQLAQTKSSMIDFAEGLKKAAIESGVGDIFSGENDPVAKLKTALSTEGADVAAAFQQFIKEITGQGGADAEGEGQNIGQRLGEGVKKGLEDAKQLTGSQGTNNGQTPQGALEENVMAGTDAGVKGANLQLPLNATPPGSKEPPAKPSGVEKAAKGLMQGAAAAMALVSSIKAAENSVKTFSNDGASNLDKFSSALGTVASTAMAAGQMINLAGTLGLGPWGIAIGLIITAATTVAGIISGIEKVKKEKNIERWKKQLENYNEEYEKIKEKEVPREEFDELYRSYLKLAKGSREANKAQDELIEKAKEVADAYQDASLFLAATEGNVEKILEQLDYVEKQRIIKQTKPAAEGAVDAVTDLLQQELSEGESSSISSDLVVRSAKKMGYNVDTNTEFIVTDQSGWQGLQESQGSGYVMQEGDELNYGYYDTTESIRFNTTIEDYERAVALRKQLEKDFSQDVLDADEGYQQLIDYLAQGEEYYDAYIEAQDHLKDTNMQLAVLNSNIYNVDNMEKYNQRRRQLIDSLAEEYGYLDANGDVLEEHKLEYEALEEAVDNVLKTTRIGNRASTFSWLDRIAKEKDLNIEDVSKQYDEFIKKYGEERGNQLFLKIIARVSTANGLSLAQAIEQELEQAKLELKDEELEVRITIIRELKTIDADDESTTGDYKGVFEKMSPEDFEALATAAGYQREMTDDEKGYRYYNNLRKNFDKEHDNPESWTPSQRQEREHYRTEADRYKTNLQVQGYTSEDLANVLDPNYQGKFNLDREAFFRQYLGASPEQRARWATQVEIEAMQQQGALLPQRIQESQDKIVNLQGDIQGTGLTNYEDNEAVMTYFAARHMQNQFLEEHGGEEAIANDPELMDQYDKLMEATGDAWRNLDSRTRSDINYRRQYGQLTDEDIENYYDFNEQLDQEETNLKDLQLQQDLYAAGGFRDALKLEAEEWGINYDEVQQYAVALRESGQFTEDQIEASERFALEQKKVSAGIGLVKDNLKTYQREVKAGRTASEDYTKSLNQIKKGLSGILGIPVDEISDDFVKAADSAGLLEDVMNDVDGAVDKVYQFAGDKALAEMMGINPEDIVGLDPEALHNYLMSNLQGGFEGLGDDLQTIYDGLPSFNPGDLIDEPGMTSALDNVVNGMLNTQHSIGDVFDALSQMGVEAEFVPHTGEGHGQFVGTAEGVTMIDDGNGGFTPQRSDSVDFGSEEAANLTTYDLVYHKKGGGGGGSGGGGGGGGQKKKDHKKPDIGTRYHKIRAKQANNNQNKQETSRKKERAFGAEKIKQAEKEIELQKEAIELQRQYVDEINDYLAEDRTKMIEAFTPDKLGFDLGFNLEIDQDGVITNYRQLEEKLLEEENKLIDKYNEGGLDDEAYQEAQKKIDEAREYLKIYEETRDLYEEEWIKLREYLDELADSALELTKLKIDLDISISDDTLGLLDYMLEKIEDNAYKAAEAISLLGDKTNETLKRVDIYQSGLEEILNSKGLSLDDLANITDEQLINGDFTQAQIDQIREWRDAILDADKELLQMREDIIDKIIDAFNELNDKVQESYDQFDNYNSIIEDYTNITDLLAIRLNQQQKELIKMLGQAALNNAQTQAAAARAIYEEALANQQAAQKAYEQAVANGDTEAMRQWEKVVKETQTVLDDAQQQWLEAWQAALEKAQELYTKAIENTVKAFEESVSGAFGALDYLQSAFDRMGQTNDQYLQDFEKLYELNKLNRDIQNAIDDTTNIRDKQALRDLQKEINRLQKEGIELSQYDVDALRKKFELEQARLALEDARNAKSEVRLQRDANGNWGYVYTAKEDEVAKAEQEYEDKLYEYQKLNDEYITELQSRVLETQTTYRDALAEIYNDTTLTDAQREARINELNNWLQAELSYFEQQLNNAMDNQQGTLDLYYNKYNDAQAKLADSWDETTLRMLIGAESVADYMDNVKKSVEDMLQSSSEALSQYNKDVDETNHMAGVETEDYGKEVSDAIATIGNTSAKTNEEIVKLSEELKDNFVDSLKEAINWEEEYADKINAAVDANESFIKSINEMIAKLAELESSNPGLEKARTAYQAAEMAHEEYVQEWKRQHPDEDVVEADIVDEAWEKAKAEWQKYLEEIIGISPIYDTGVPQSLKTGGYTGRWSIASAKTGMYTGSWAGADVEENGRLAFLHQKELVLNADDTQNFLDATQILRTIDLSTDMFSKGLGNIITPWISNMRQQDLEQNVHIEASFPNVTEHNEIERAFDNLINRAAQYVNRK